MEETGFDISSRISKNDFIEVHLGQDGLRQQRSKLFIVRGVCPLTEPTSAKQNIDEGIQPRLNARKYKASEKSDTAMRKM